MTNRTCALATTLSLFLWASPAFAGQIKFVLTLTSSAPDAGGVFHIIDGVGMATDIDGFASLASVAPSSFTFKIHVKLADLKFDTTAGEFVAVLGPDPAVAHTTELFLNGSLIGHTSDAVYISTGNVVTNSARSRSSEHVNGVVGHPFHTEVLAQSHGTGALIVMFDPYPPAQPTGVFTVTGTISTPPFEVHVEPQPAVAGDNLTMVITGDVCNSQYSAAELAAGAATVTRGADCVSPLTPFTARIPLGALPAGAYTARALESNGTLEGAAEFSVTPRVNAVEGTCLPDADTLCLQGGRFRVEGSFPEPALKIPKARIMSYEAGALYFFSSGNPEVTVKVLDGCTNNGHYWLFASGMTNVGVTVRIRDMQTGAERVISTPNGTAFPTHQDIRAFPCSGG